uniref:Hypothetical intron-encoded protein n=1 Tax=Mesostigma viride TaxID=41882 RepID=Q8W9R2_MESVI|nr:hypothetical intron-encoded protein [Mesostigma viride]AAL36746.1 hypothetical intron-encoded protein [Mesostigma viride]
MIYNNFYFWVGLMDGDGSIQVNHWRKKCLQFRFVIKLKDTFLNHQMLTQFCQCLMGGRITNSSKGFIVWVVNDKKTILRLANLLDKFPPLTKRLQCQLEFLKENLQRNNIDWYLMNRNSKYNKTDLDKTDPELNPYWISGFIEALPCCFTIRKANNHSFSISLPNEGGRVLLEKIRDYFGCPSSNKIHKKKTFYVLEIYRKEILFSIINHLTQKAPLLGEKKISFKYFQSVMLSHHCGNSFPVS